MCLVDMGVNRVLVTVESPSGRHSVSLPEDAPLGDLLPGILEACEGFADPSGWALAPRGEARIEASRTLREIGLYAGAVIELIPPPAEPGPPRTPPPAPRIDSMRGSDYRRLLDQAIRGARLSSTVVAVVGAQPGAGATTIAALLATLASSLRPEPVVAVDANPQTGTLSHWLVPEGALSAAAFRALFDPSVSPLAVEDALVPAAPRLAVLPAPLDASAGEADAATWAALIGHLRRLRHLVVIDCGSGTQREAVKAALSSADAIVYVSRAEPPLSPPQHWQKPLVLVANQRHRRSRMTRSAAGVPGIAVALDDAAASRLRRGGFDWNRAPAPWQEALRELVSVLLASG